MPDDQYLPLTPRLKATITPDMIRIHDFGPPLGVCGAVSCNEVDSTSA
jgi:hypothetical protein